jgi:hypothetical protein
MDGERPGAKGLQDEANRKILKRGTGNPQWEQIFLKE